MKLDAPENLRLNHNFSHYISVLSCLESHFSPNLPHNVGYLFINTVIRQEKIWIIFEISAIKWAATRFDVWGAFLSLAVLLLP